MNKSLIKILVVGSAVLASFNLAAADNFSKAQEQKLVQVCEAMLTGSKFQLNDAIGRLYSTSAVPLKPKLYRRVVDDLVCNGTDLITFAVRNGAYENASFLASRSGSKMDIDEMYASNNAQK